MPDSLDWLCDRMSVPVLREDERGGVVLSEQARALLPNANYPNLGMALRALLGDGVDPAAIDRAIALAQSGTRAELVSLAGEQVLVIPAPGARAMAVVVP